MGSLVCRKPIYPAGTVNAQRPDWLVAVTFASVDDPVCVLNSPNWNPFTVLMSVAVAQSRWAACPPNDSAHDPTAADGVVPGVASGPVQMAAISSGPPADPPHPASTSTIDNTATKRASLVPPAFMAWKRSEAPRGFAAGFSRACRRS